MFDDVLDDHERLFQRQRVPVVMGVVLPVRQYVPTLLTSGGRVDRVFARVTGHVKHHDQGAGPVGDDRQQPSPIIGEPGLEASIMGS